MWSFFFKSYLPSDAQERLRRYVYRGTDKSLFYNYLMSPLCARLVKQLPLWLSANVISVMALFLVFTAHFLLAFYMPTFTVIGNVNFDESLSRRGVDMELNKNNLSLSSPPAFVFIFNALALFLYIILDNLDGHQARRTKTASPLGLIIDHGCDAINCIVIALSASASLSLGPTWKTWFFLIFIVTGFFMNTWEEYYIGELVLPVINGANEGILTIIFMYLFTAWVKGPQWWHNNGLRLPHSLLPKALAQPAQLAAVTVEKNILQVICPWVNAPFFLLPNVNNISLSSFFGINCSDAYINSPPLPTITVNEKTDTSLFIGHSKIQNFVLKLYDPSMPENIWIRFNTLAVVFFGLVTVITVIGNLINVYYVVSRTSAKEARRSRHFSGKLRFVLILLRLLPLVVLMLFSTFWLFTSPSNIFHRYPRIFCWSFGIVFTNYSITLMIAHICDMKFSLFSRVFWMFFFNGAYMFIAYYCKPIRSTQHNCSAYYSIFPSFITSSNFWAFVSNEESMLYLLFMLSVFSHIHLTFSVVIETASALKLSVFSVPRVNQETLKKLQMELKAERNM